MTGATVIHVEGKDRIVMVFPSDRGANPEEAFTLLMMEAKRIPSITYYRSAHVAEQVFIEMLQTSGLDIFVTR